MHFGNEVSGTQHKSGAISPSQRRRDRTLGQWLSPLRRCSRSGVNSCWGFQTMQDNNRSVCKRIVTPQTLLRQAPGPYRPTVCKRRDLDILVPLFAIEGRNRFIGHHFVGALCGLVRIKVPELGSPVSETLQMTNIFWMASTKQAGRADLRPSDAPATRTQTFLCGYSLRFATAPVTSD